MLIERKLFGSEILKSIWTCLCLSSCALGLSQDVIKLPHDINTESYDEIAFLADTAGSQFFFTRVGSPDMNRRLYQNGRDVGSNASPAEFERMVQQVYSEIAQRHIENPIASSINQDIFFATPGENDSWIVSHPDYPINSALPTSAVGVLENPVGIFVLNHYFESGNMQEGISKMHLGGDGGASFPKPIFINDIQNRSHEINVFVTSDGEVAIMALHRTGGPADSDLYISFYSGGGDQWTRPRNLGVDINTKFRESTPFLTRDKRYLYFASNRPGGAGGTDLYRSDRLNYSYNKWTAPKRLNDEINSSADESHPCYVPSKQDFYFSSNREGSFDIYKYKEQEKIESRDIVITGTIINKATGKAMGADLFYGPESISDYLEYYSTFNGKFKIVVNTAEEFKFYAKKPGFERHIVRMNFDSLVPPGVFEYDMDLLLYPEKKSATAINTPQEKNQDRIFDMTVDEIKERKTLTIHNIQFVRSKALVLQSSRPYLNQLYRLLDENPEIRIRITGHTDNQGAKDLLMKLSLDRANAVKLYLIQKGITGARIETLGMGARDSLNANETEKERGINRRVEVTILE